jgi:4-aminobutyrate aminotransferase-like enzyme
MIWATAEGCRVVDSNGREYLDLSGGFGVAALGHRNPVVAAAMADQAERCVHALGDLAEADVAAELRRRLGQGGHEVLLGVTGEDAVEIALRTALLVTGSQASSRSKALTTGPACSHSRPQASSAFGRRSEPGFSAPSTGSPTGRIPVGYLETRRA